MTTAQWLSAVLSVWGATGMWVAGKGAWKGWAMGLAAQPIWVAFALSVHTWPLIFSPLLYGTVYLRNLWRWKAGTYSPKTGVRLAAVKIVDGVPMPDARRRVRRELARASRKR